jgi:hypothetical protein
MVGIKDVFVFALAGAAFTVLIAAVIPFKRLPGHGEKVNEVVDGNEEKMANSI